MKMHIKVIGLFLVFIISSCTNTASDVFQTEDFIQLNYQNGPELTPDNEVVRVWIKNETEYCLAFPSDYGLRVYFEEDEVLHEVQNLILYVKKDPIILKPKGDIFSEGLVSIRPDVSGLTLKESTKFYAVVAGTICDNTKITFKYKIPFVITP